MRVLLLGFFGGVASGRLLFLYGFRGVGACGRLLFLYEFRGEGDCGMLSLLKMGGNGSGLKGVGIGLAGECCASEALEIAMMMEV